MNRFVVASALPFSALMLALTACSPKKEDKPPAPKVTASAEKANAPAVAASMEALPKYGPAPTWKLQDVNGKEVTSDEFKGKVVVLDFWATWCPPCRAEIPGYTELMTKYGADGLVIVGVSMDEGGPEVVKPFMEKMKINYPVLMANEGIAAAFGGMDAIPTTFIIDRSGEVRDKKVGSEETAEYEKKIVAVLHEKA
jgi:peroxiredoxin